MWRVWVVSVGLVVFWQTPLDARDKPIEELPKDVWDLAFVWTEPLKQVATHAKRFDPVSSLWIGLLDGSVKSVERTAGFLLSGFEQPKSSGSSRPSDGRPGALFRYSF